MSNVKLTCLDLFSGAGGLSEGFLETKKYRFLAHVEWELPMVNTLRSNLIKRWGYTEEDAKRSVIHFDIQQTNELLFGIIEDECKKKYLSSNSDDFIKHGLIGVTKGEKIDVIIGGPPCQAYSIAGRAQDPYSMKNDYRNYLFESFVKVVDYYKPKLFVFENVPGILSACPGDEKVIKRIFRAFDCIGYEIRTPDEMKKSIYSSSDFCVPQERHRVIIFGVRKDCNMKLQDFYDSLDLEKKRGRKKTVRDAIGFMPKFRPLPVPYKKGAKNISHEAIGENPYTLHEARYNNKRDLNVFKEWISRDMNKLSNEEQCKYYESVTGRHTNHNKYRSLEWGKPSPTVVAHLYKDGFMFIHPDIEQLRSITVREAALLQTFPIDYDFVGSTAYCFKMIGNAVPVLFAKAIANAVYKTFKKYGN